MTRSQAEAFVKQISNHGRGAHLDRVAKNLNGYAVIVGDGSDERYLTGIEEAVRFVDGLRSEGAGS